jgi:hypothetical protein
MVNKILVPNRREMAIPSARVSAGKEVVQLCGSNERVKSLNKGPRHSSNICLTKGG